MPKFSWNLLLTAFGLFAHIGFSHAQTAQAVERSEQRRIRRPVALSLAGDSLFVANRRSGSVTIIDTKRRSIAAEVSIARRLSDLSSVPNSSMFLATDEAKNEVLLLHAGANSDLKVIHRLTVATSPVSVRVSGDGTIGSVASLWARRLTLIGIEHGKKGMPRGARLKSIATIDLPFAPRRQWFAPKHNRLVVADAFRGRLAVIDTKQHALLRIHNFAGHNIGGLVAGPSGRELLVTHQTLSSDATTTRVNVFWGNVMGNVVRKVRLDELFSTKDEPRSDDQMTERDLTYGTLLDLGRPGRGAGDPAGILVLEDGKMIVSLAGVDEIAVGADPQRAVWRRKVGRRPTALAMDSRQRFVYVANTLADSVSVFDLSKMEVVVTISLGTTPKHATPKHATPNQTMIERGESLFYDARLSLHGWYSCHSCHTDGHANGQKNDNFSDGTEATPKAVLSLLGVGKTAPLAWNGSRTSLTDQISSSIHKTMRGDPARTSRADVQAIAAYLETLNPPPSIDAARGTLNPPAIKRGKLVFQKHGCVNCHRPPLYTSPSTFDVGIPDESGAKKFNPPSLRGVSQRGPFFHDHRAARLQDVFLRHGHGESRKLSAKQMDDLLSFLRSL